ncbi:MAG: hypothetical protein H0T46_09840 [Deltaproteobacteria bacterium]|nr:hypothetical protein [Deltaproteobacteria bacterium]
MKTIAIGTALLTAAGAGCGSDDSSGPLGNVDSLIVLQRPARNDMGDIFQYTSYKPKTESGINARLVKLEPPTADGTQTVICCDKAGPEFANVDISGYDISFDAKQIVFSGKLANNQNYGLFLLTLADGSVDQIPTDPARDYVSPIFLPGDKIMFTTNSIVESGARQHRDEYERGTTLQLGRINIDGTGEELGARNLSHRTFPTLMSDGRVMFTQWDHLGGMNAGHLMFVNQDMTNLREAFGKEGTGASNSTLKAQEISPGRFVAIATSRSRTIQAGALVDVRLGISETVDGSVMARERQSEANASYKDLTPDVPHDNMPSADTVGRYYDAYALNAKDKPDLIVSWANGPVESSVLGLAGLSADFGVFLLDTQRNQKHPLINHEEMWDIFPRPLTTRPVPSISGSAIDPTLGGASMIGSMNVYESSLKTFAPGSIYGVRVMEGFSSEEGFPEMFGTTMFEGQANLGVARVQADGSWLAKVPANVPLHVQTVDTFGMSMFSEPVWVSARANEARVCGGCHESRDRPTVIDPGQTDAFAVGATNMYGLTPRANRMSSDTSRDKVMGVGWSNTVQRIFDNNCLGCHDSRNIAGVQPYTITDPVAGTSIQWTFNLEGTPLPATFAEIGGEPAFTASYFSIAGPDMEAIEMGGLMVSGNFKVYASPENARDSILIKMLNPKRQFPTQTNERAFATSPHMAAVGQGGDLTADEFYQLILNIDMGVNFYARENNPGLNVY